VRNTDLVISIAKSIDEFQPREYKDKEKSKLYSTFGRRDSEKEEDKFGGCLQHHYKGYKIGTKEKRRYSLLNSLVLFVKGHIRWMNAQR